MIQKGLIMLKLLIYTFIKRLKEEDLTAYAAQITFYMILSLFPFLAFLGSLLSHIQFASIEHVIEILVQMHTIPAPVADLVFDVFRNLGSHAYPSYPLYIIVILYASSKCIRGVMNGIHMAYRTTETRLLIKRFLLSAFYTLCFAIVIVLFIGLVLFGEQLMNMFFTFLGFTDFFRQLLTFLRFLVPLFFMFITYMLLYRFIPTKSLRFRNVYLGALFSTVCSFVVSQVFSLYVSNFNNYTSLYGSISGIIILLLWMYLISIILLLGAMLNAILDEMSN